MNLLYYLADAFIDTFGITRPSEKAHRQAALFILTLIVLVIVDVAFAGYFIPMWSR